MRTAPQSSYSPWWRPRTGWLVLGFRRRGKRVHVTMGHPDVPYLRHINAPDMDVAVAWAMIARNGTVHWRPKARAGAQAA